MSEDVLVSLDDHDFLIIDSTVLACFSALRCSGK
jgi:hypothetical protein